MTLSLWKRIIQEDWESFLILNFEKETIMTKEKCVCVYCKGSGECSLCDGCGGTKTRSGMNPRGGSSEPGSFTCHQCGGHGYCLDCHGSGVKNHYDFPGIYCPIFQAGYGGRWIVNTKIRQEKEKK